MSVEQADNMSPKSQDVTSQKKKSKRRKKKTKRNVKTITEEELGELTEKEEQLMKQDWSEFKSDVSMKTLIN